MVVLANSARTKNVALICLLSKKFKNSLILKIKKSSPLMENIMTIEKGLQGQ